MQACRGTDGSGGSHSYFAEAPDGRATADWIAEQTWFDGRLGSYGASYMGFTQWALASTRPPHLQAMAVALSTSVRKFSWYPGDSLALEVIIPWDLGAVMFNKPTSTAIVDDVTPEAVERRMAELQAGFDHLPLGDVIRHLTGEDLPLYHDQLAHGGRDDPFWAAVDFRGHAPRLGHPHPARRRVARLPAARACSRTTRSSATHPRPSTCASAPAGTSAAAAKAA